MFGLMKAGGCARKTEARYERARAYCGTCKTMGRLYGQSTRLLLSHDAAFLGELLLALSPEPDWAPAYTPRRCASLPSNAQIPPALAYAATANVALAEFAVRDKIADASKLWHTVRLALNRPFNRARARLAAWNVPIDSLFQLQTRQAEIERERNQTLAYYATPTGDATRLVFSHGATVVAPDSAATLGALGEAFGRLVYTIDALNDRAEDAKKGDFNAVAAAGATVTETRAYLRQLLSDALSALNALPIPSEKRALFAGRLRTSVASATGNTLNMTMDGGEADDPAAPPIVRRARRWGNCCGSQDDDFCDCCCDGADCACDCCDGDCCCSGCGCHNCDGSCCHCNCDCSSCSDCCNCCDGCNCCDSGCCCDGCDCK